MTRAPPLALVAILESRPFTTSSTYRYRIKPARKAASESSTSPPKRKQKAPLPIPAARIWCQPGFWGSFSISFNFALASVGVKKPSSISLDSSFTASIRSSLAPASGIWRTRT